MRCLVAFFIISSTLTSIATSNVNKFTHKQLTGYFELITNRCRKDRRQMRLAVERELLILLTIKMNSQARNAKNRFLDVHELRDKSVA